MVSAPLPLEVAAFGRDKGSTHLVRDENRCPLAKGGFEYKFFCLTAGGNSEIVVPCSVFSCTQVKGLLYRHVAMVVEGELQDRSMAKAMKLGRKKCFKDSLLTNPARRTVLKEANPRNTATESCESDETGECHVKVKGER